MTSGELMDAMLAGAMLIDDSEGWERRRTLNLDGPGRLHAGGWRSALGDAASRHLLSVLWEPDRWTALHPHRFMEGDAGGDCRKVGCGFHLMCVVHDFPAIAAAAGHA